MPILVEDDLALFSGGFQRVLHADAMLVGNDAIVAAMSQKDRIFDFLDQIDR